MTLPDQKAAANPTSFRGTRQVLFRSCEDIDFHGTSTTATPTTPWTTATQRPDAVPAATAPTPLGNATSGATSRARLVIRGGGWVSVAESTVLRLHRPPGR
jgi:hypothetical protein